MQEKGKQIGIGTLLSYIALAVNSLTNLLLTPAITDKIGDGQYGVYKTILALISYLSVCKFGFGSAAVRYIAEYRATGRKDKEKEFLTVIKWLNLFACIVVCIVGVIIYRYIPRIFGESFTGEEIQLASDLFILLIVSVVLSVINDIYDAIVTAYEEFVFQKIVDIVRSLLRVALIVAVLIVSPMAVGLTIVDIFINLLLLVANYYKVTNLKVKTTYIFDDYKNVDFSYYKPVIVFSLYVLLNSLVNQMIWSTDSIIVGMRLDSFQAAVYSVGSNISSLFYTASIVVSNLLLPKAVKMVTQNADAQEMTDFFVQIARFQAIIIFGILGAYCILGKQFIVLWMGEKYVDAWMSSLLVMIGTIFASLVVSGHAILRAQNRQGFLMIVYFCIFAANVVLTYIVVPYEGINGAAFMTFISFTFGNVLFIWPYYHIKVGINMFFFLKSMLTVVSIFIGIVFVGRIIVSYWIVDSWKMFVVGCVAYSVIYLILIWMCYLKRGEKEQLLRKIKS